MYKANKNKINIMHMSINKNNDKHIIKIRKLILHAPNIIQ
jgi:hypothetical protein